MKSGFIRVAVAQVPLLEREAPDLQDPFGRGNLAPVFKIVTVGVGR